MIPKHYLVKRFFVQLFAQVIVMGLIAGAYPPSSFAQEPSLSDSTLSLLNLNELTDAVLHQQWSPVASGGMISFRLDSQELFEGVPSFHVITDIPCNLGGARFAFLEKRFESVLDLSDYSSLTIWVKTQTNLYSELSIILVEEDGEEWESTRLIRGRGWEQIDIALARGAQEPANPWHHPYDFVLPDWLPRDQIKNNELDLTEISAFRLKLVSDTTRCDQQPRTDAWFGEIALSAQPVYTPPPIELPTIEPFNYQNHSQLNRAWHVSSSGDVILSVDTAEGMAPPSMRGHVHLPCEADPNDRFINISRRFSEPIDLSAYSSIVVVLRTAVAEPVYGGEFTIVLWEADEDREEIWESTRWFAASNLWQEIEVSLAGAVVNLSDTDERNPWNHAADFTVPFWEEIADGHLDLSAVVAIGIKSSTTGEVCATHPSSEFWIDSISVR